MTHPAFAEMKASREAKLDSMVGKRHAHHELPSQKAQRLATGGTADGTPDESDMPTTMSPANETTHFMPKADFDPYGTMGNTGPSLSEAQTDEVGASRRSDNARGGDMRGTHYDRSGATYGGSREDRGILDNDTHNYDKKPRG